MSNNNNGRNKVINFGRNRIFKSLSEALASSHVTSNDQVPFPQPSPRLFRNWYLLIFKKWFHHSGPETLEKSRPKKFVKSNELISRKNIWSTTSIF